MGLNYSVALRNAQLDQIETTIGSAPVLRFYSGPPPALTSDPASGTLIVSMTLPTDWMAAAVNGTKSKSGSWAGTTGPGGTMGWFGLWDSGILTRHMQGLVGDIGSGADVEFTTATLDPGQSIVINTWEMSAGNS